MCVKRECTKIGGMNGLSRRSLFGITGVVVCRAQQQPSDRDVFRGFLEWAEAQPLAAATPARYREKLISDGMQSSEADRRLKVISDPSHAADRIDEFWSMMAEKPANARFRVTPSRWLTESVRGIKPGKALDLGMGQGRNALFLSRQGWDVTGIDMASVAIEQAKAQASQLGIKYNVVVADIDRWDFGRSQWDLIAAIYEPDFRWVRKICDGLKPGGLFVRENYVFSKEENEPLKKFMELRISRYEDRTDEPDYNPSGEHAELQRVQRMIAQKQ